MVFVDRFLGRFQVWFHACRCVCTVTTSVFSGAERKRVAGGVGVDGGLIRLNQGSGSVFRCREKEGGEGLMEG